MTATLALALPGLDGVGKILVFLLMLSVLVVLHEGGHFLLARLNGVRVNDFAVGFGPTLLKWTSPRSGTNYRLNALPIGGYCAMQGEDGKSSEAEQQRQFRDDAKVGSDNFQAKKPVARLSIVVAGPIANFLLAYLILFVGAVTFGIASSSWSTEIGPLEPGSPGAAAGFAIGDRIVAIDGVKYDNGEKLVAKIKTSAGVPLRIAFDRHGVVRTVTVTPRPVKENGKTIGRIGFQRIPEFQRVGFVQAVPVAAGEFYNAIAMQIGGYAGLIRHPAQVGASVQGPIGMARVASAEQDLGWAAYFQFAAIISIALGILNLLPFPALDGGRGVFIIAEMLRGRPVEPEKEALVHVTGFAVLMVLMVFVAYHDIANIVSGKGVL
jgi:regulator of sigma E protease